MIGSDITVLGIDSATHVGLIALAGDESIGKQIDVPLAKGLSRLQSIAHETAQFLDIWKPQVAVMEGLAYGNTSTLVLLVQCATVIQLELHKRGIVWWTCAPTSLKKWTTGNGSASKDMMSASVFERWGYRSHSTDLVDAYALARMGQLGPEKLTAMKGLNRGS